MKLYRIGDLVKHTIGYNNGESIDVYCKLISIKDFNNNIYNHYEVITGEGDKNSKVLFELKGIAYCKDLKQTNIIIKDVNPHKVHSHYDFWIKETVDKIEFLERKKQFLLKNKNMLDKINEIL